jgi:hypothetical protein
MEIQDTISDLLIIMGFFYEVKNSALLNFFVFPLEIERAGDNFPCPQVCSLN